MCQSLPGSTYSCQCQTGFHGDNCENAVDVCLSGDAQCSEGSTCIAVGDGYKCICQLGRMGDLCNETQGMQTMITLLNQCFCFFQFLNHSVQLKDVCNANACWLVSYNTLIITNVAKRFYYNFSVNFLQITRIRQQKSFQTKILEITSLVNHHPVNIIISKDKIMLDSQC